VGGLCGGTLEICESYGPPFAELAAGWADFRYSGTIGTGLVTIVISYRVA
jgi:hypothetical protein